MGMQYWQQTGVLHNLALSQRSPNKSYLECPSGFLEIPVFTVVRKINEGFELTPSYVEDIKPRTFPKVLRNLWLMSFVQLTLLMLLVWAVVPFTDIQAHSGNILSLLAEHASGAKWLRVWLVTDAVLVLCAGLSHGNKFNLGVLTGIISSCGAIERLSRDHILPSFFLQTTKFTHAPYLSIIIFTVIGLAMFGVVRGNLTILSGQFAISFILVMGLFALSNLLLKFNRDRLVRRPHVPLPLVLVALVVVGVVVAGNIAMSPVIVGYFAVFFVVALVAMTYTGFRGQLALVLYWVYNRNTRLHSWRWTKDWHKRLIYRIQRAKKQPVIFFAKTDEVFS
jgi:amino acid transporter